MEIAQTPESVALVLLHYIASAEGRALDKSDPGQKADRKWILDTYSECLKAAINKRYIPTSKGVEAATAA